MAYGIANTGGPFQSDIDEIMQAIKDLGGGGSGGKYIGGTELSSDATGSDSKAQYSVIKKTASSSPQALFGVSCKVPPGSYSVMLRLKVSDIAVIDNLIDITAKVDSASGTQLKEAYIKPSMFSAADKFQTIGLVVDFDAGKNNSLYLSATLLSCSTAVTVTIDYVLIAPAYTAVSSIA